MLEEKVASIKVWIRVLTETGSNSDIESEKKVKLTATMTLMVKPPRASWLQIVKPQSEARMAAQKARTVVLEQRTSFHLVGLGLSLGFGLLLFKWMGKAQI